VFTGVEGSLAAARPIIIRSQLDLILSRPHQQERSLQLRASDPTPLLPYS